MTAATLNISVRYYGSTYIARCNGKTASCTSSPEAAAESVARKAAQVLLDLGVISEISEKLHLKEVSHDCFYTCEVGPVHPRRTAP